MTVTERDRFEDLASLYFDQALDADGRDELNRLIEDHPELAVRFVRLGRIHGGLRELEVAGVSKTASPSRSRFGVASALVGAAAALLLVFLVGRSEPPGPQEAPAAPAPAFKAALIVGEVPMAVGDELLQNRLKGLGFEVVPMDDDAVKPGDADGFDLILVTESVWSDKVGPAFTDAAVPILNCEPHLNGSLGLSRRPPGPKEYLGKTDRQRLRILDAGHPLAAGLDGLVNVYVTRATISWGFPHDEAVRIASCDDDEEHVAIFAYESGADVDGRTLPARRVSFFLSDVLQDVTLLAPEGWALFDAAVRWSIGRS